MPPPTRVIVALMSAILLLSGCGDTSASSTSGSTSATTSESAPESPEASPGESPGQSTSSGKAKSRSGTDDGGTTIEITVQGDTLRPQGASIKVAVGKPIRLRIVADQPGELHLHSSPEQQFDYPAGTTTKTFTIDRPGVVELESHTLDRLVAQLEVR